MQAGAIISYPEWPQSLSCCSFWHILPQKIFFFFLETYISVQLKSLIGSPFSAISREFTKHFRKWQRQRQLRSFLHSRSRSCYREICVTKLAVKQGEQENFVFIQDVSETAAKLDMPNLKTVQDMILLAHADHLVDDDECLLLYDFYMIDQKILTYHIIVMENST